MEHKTQIRKFRLGLVLWLLSAVPVIMAHVGSPNVFYDGLAGAYPVRVVIQAPEVIPGLAQISVQVKSGEVTSVKVLPIRWNTGKDGAPRPDEARPVRGEVNHFTAELWFMKDGAHSVEIQVSGGLGEGTALIPMNAVATRTLPMNPFLQGLLIFLGALLITLSASIVGAIFRESRLEPGSTPTRRQGWIGRLAFIVQLLIVLGLARGGILWWNAEENDYKQHRLFKPYTVEARVESTDNGTVLGLDIPDERFQRGAPLVPDHGKLMHAFVMKEEDLSVFAHLHPLRRARSRFETALPPMPSGRYRVYADITHETGFSTTCMAMFDLPIATQASLPDSPSSALRDPDDSWVDLSLAGKTPMERNTRTEFSLGDGYEMNWIGDPSMTIQAEQTIDLVFRIHSVDQSPIELETYMGMYCHVVVGNASGDVFVHLHPSGSVSMASLQLFEMRETGNASRQVTYGALDPLCELPSLESSTQRWNQLYAPNDGHTVSSVYAFPKPGKYRVWVQVKLKGHVRTGVFDFNVPDPEG